MSSPLDKLFRIGYVAKGIIYGLIGLLAVLYLFGQGGKVTDGEGAIRTIGAQRHFGDELLPFIGGGLGLYALWRFFDAAFDFDRRGKDLFAIARRIGVVFSGFSYAALSYYAFKLAFGPGGGPKTPSKHEITAQVLSTPWGPWALGAVGLIFIISGGYYLTDGLRGEFMEHYQRGKMSRAARRTARVIGTIGIAARAIAFFIIGGFIVRAATRSSAREVKGLGEALRAIATGDEGRALLMVVAFGFVAYGLYCFSNAWYRHFELRAP